MILTNAGQSKFARSTVLVYEGYWTGDGERANRGKCPVAKCKIKFDSLAQHLKTHKAWRKKA